MITPIVFALVNIVLSTCPSLPARSSPPANIRDVRPDDIKVIAAIGDSITAGFGAKGLANPKQPIDIQNLDEDRGVSWSMGGDDGAITIANFVKQYSPNVVGASVGKHIVNLCYGPLCPPFQYKPELDHFNAARSGALAMNLMDEVNWLVAQMHQSPNVDMVNDYKLLNLFIGSNDDCLGCLPILGKSVLSPDAFEETMREVIWELKHQIPKLIVNVHQQFKVSGIETLTKNSQHCATLRAFGFGIECSCAYQLWPFGDSTRRSMDNLVDEYNQRLLNIRQDYLAENNDSFLLIVDPLFTGVHLQDWTLDYISDVDCFHPNVQAHQIMAVGSWNNMFLPFEQKSTLVDPKAPLQPFCPTADSRFSA
ncbi:hypothetical protein HDV04_006315 [Boothiomyces sp. JEL0838]|nr:hypothetical protein HDV04_006315 [Boothiomyces sp. JEL0838]